MARGFIAANFGSDSANRRRNSKLMTGKSQMSKKLVVESRELAVLASRAFRACAALHQTAAERSEHNDNRFAMDWIHA